MTTDSKLISIFRSRIARLDRRIDEFKEKFAKDPAYALIWSNNTFKDAAELKVLRESLDALEGGYTTLENIETSLTNRVLSMSKYPPQSTSPTSNLIEQYELAAMASILTELRLSH